LKLLLQRLFLCASAQQPVQPAQQMQGSCWQQPQHQVLLVLDLLLLCYPC
jgi:hypothetical protein